MLIQLLKAILQIGFTGTLFVLVITSCVERFDSQTLSQPDIRQKEVSPPTSELIPLLLDDNVQTREIAFKRLKELGTDIAVPTLIRALQDDDWQIQIISAYTLGRLGSEAESAISALSQVIKDENPDVRFVVVQALGEIGSEAVVPALIESLQDENENVRVSAVEALKKIGSAAEPAVPLLTKVFWDGNWFIRSNSAKIITNLGLEHIDYSILIEPWKNSNNLQLTPDSLVSLMLALNPSFLDQPEQLPLFFVNSLQETDNTNFLSTSAALQNLSSSSLGRSYKDVVLQHLLQKFPLKGIIQNLKNSDVKSRRQSVEILGNIILWSNLHDKPDKTLIRQTSLALISVLEDPEPEIRKAAIEILINIYFIDNSITIAILESSIKNKDRIVRQIATSNLSNIRFTTSNTNSDAKAIISILMKALKDSDSIVRQNAIDTIISRKDTFSQLNKSSLYNQMLWDFLTADNTDENTRLSIISKLEQPIPVLVKLIESNSTVELRRTAVRELWQILLKSNNNVNKVSEAIALKALHQALKDDDLGVIQNAAIGLLAMDKIKIASAFDIINQGLSSEDPFIQMDAVSSLGIILFPHENTGFSKINVKSDVQIIRSYTQELLPLLVNLFESDIKPLRYATALLLTTNFDIENEDILIILRTIIDSETGFDISNNASNAISNLSPEKAMYLLIKSQRFTKDQDKKYSTDCPIYFNRDISSFDSAESYKFLISALKNSNSRFSVVQAIRGSLSSEDITTKKFLDTFIIPLISILENTEKNENIAIRDVLKYKNKDIRRSAAFLLGEIASSDIISKKKSELKETIKSSLLKVVENEEEDIDIRWMAASSLQLLEVEIEWFYQKNSLINPKKIKQYPPENFRLSFDRYYARIVYDGEPQCGDGLYEIYTSLRRRLARRNSNKK